MNKQDACKNVSLKKEVGIAIMSKETSSLAARTSHKK